MSTVLLAQVVSARLQGYASQPFQLPSHMLSFTAYSLSQHPVVLVPESCSLRIDPPGKLFDPCKSSILVGSCSKFGVHITEWTVDHMLVTST